MVILPGVFGKAVHQHDDAPGGACSGPRTGVEVQVIAGEEVPFVCGIHGASVRHYVRRSPMRFRGLDWEGTCSPGPVV